MTTASDDQIVELQVKIKRLTIDLESEVRFSARIYRDVSLVLDEKLGTEEDDGTGEGLAADVLLAIDTAHAAGYAEGVAKVKAAVEPALLMGGQTPLIRCNAAINALAAVEGDAS